MVAKGQKGHTMTERDASTKALDEKMQALAKAIVERGIKEPSRELISEFLNKNELGAAWKRLEKARGRAPANVQEAWDDLSKIHQGRASEMRLSILAKFTLGIADLAPPHSWQDHLIVITEELNVINKRKKEI